jgi:dihydroorotate dehydrogenase electron transfer subunit
MTEYPIITAKIKGVYKENFRVTTCELDYKLEAEPGQFIMLWIPGKGEKPMGIADTNPLTISVAHVGEFTGEMKKLKEGGLISFRGPMGKGFKIPEKTDSMLIIAGGTGVVPLHLLAKKAKKLGIRTFSVLGAKTKDELSYEKKFLDLTEELLVTTDDGSKGFKGNAVEGAQELLKKHGIDLVCGCGPEKMMKSLAELCQKKNIPCQLSLERYMKCGTGICGSCMIGDKRVCKDGPVFSAAEALSFKEFGVLKRDASGRHVRL